MPYVPQVDHMRRVRNLIEGRSPQAGADVQRLASSYRRSLDQHHLDPANTAGPRVLSASELRQIQHQEECFLRASGQCLSMLHQTVREADYCVMLTNASGVTIDYRVDRDRRGDFKRAGLYLGSCWSEREEGTCGVASVLQDRMPITVHKTDHFRAAFTTLTCSASPIFAPDGGLIGVLDASAIRSPDARDSQRLVNRIVRQSAVLIEDGYFLNATAGDWVLLAHRSRHYVEAQPEILIAFDAVGNITAANRCARACIPALKHLPLPLEQVFDIRPERLLGARAEQALVSLRLLDGGALLHARVRIPARRAPAAAVSSSMSGAAMPADRAQPAGASEPELLERKHIIAALDECKWRPVPAAERLGISRATLYRRMRRFDIVPPHRR
ncbi:sigma-54-dependent Fis family transcriptional regulator [Herbaspirillum sp. SJZ099]|uniref:sigma-54-dependent Fis family transcriptional regulator n=1 Tax=Herbaspirillum sp. SJZ099 TaxID=2572916 RepID=UPI00119F9B80|nr:helix-turn-helix domain-containing protein [Herbaspirillum sp. SJZ099]TWC63172.1 GAF domain-containing protein [Herbaspirillum sp. SJZ099]